MSKFKNGWQPANSSCTTTGEMVCCSCRLPIGKDQYYQYRQKSFNKGNDWAYQCQHKECATTYADAWANFLCNQDEDRAYAKHIMDIAIDASQDSFDEMQKIEGSIYSLIDAGYSVVKTDDLIPVSDYMLLKDTLISAQNFWDSRLKELGILSPQANHIRAVIAPALKRVK